MGNVWNWTVTGNAELQTSMSLKDVWGSHSLGMCASLECSIIQHNMAHISLNHYMEAEKNVPRILKVRAAVKGWRL